MSNSSIQRNGNCLTIGEVRKVLGTNIVPILYPPNQNFPILAPPNKIATKSDFALMVAGASAGAFTGGNAEVSDKIVTSDDNDDVLLEFAYCSEFWNDEYFDFSTGNAYINLVINTDGTGVIKIGACPSYFTLYSLKSESWVMYDSDKLKTLMNIDVFNFLWNVDEYSANVLSEKDIAIDSDTYSLRLIVNGHNITDDRRCLYMYIEIPFTHSITAEAIDNTDSITNSGTYWFVKSMIESIRKRATHVLHSGGGSNIYQLKPFGYSGENVYTLTTFASKYGFCYIAYGQLNKSSSNTRMNIFTISSQYDDNWLTLPNTADTYFITQPRGWSSYVLAQTSDNSIYEYSASNFFQTVIPTISNAIDMLYVERTDSSDFVAILNRTNLLIFTVNDDVLTVIGKISIPNVVIDEGDDVQCITCVMVPIIVNSTINPKAKDDDNVHKYSNCIVLHTITANNEEFVAMLPIIDSFIDEWSYQRAKRDTKANPSKETFINTVRVNTNLWATYYYHPADNVYRIRLSYYGSITSIDDINTFTECELPYGDWLDSRLTSYLITPYGHFFAIAKGENNYLFVVENVAGASRLLHTKENALHDTHITYNGAFSPNYILVSNMLQNSPSSLMKITNDTLAWENYLDGIFTNTIYIVSSNFICMPYTILVTNGNDFSLLRYVDTNYSNDWRYQNGLLFVPNIGIAGKYDGIELLYETDSSVLSMYYDNSGDADCLLFTLWDIIEFKNMLCVLYDSDFFFYLPEIADDAHDVVVNGTGGYTFAYIYTRPFKKAHVPTIDEDCVVAVYTADTRTAYNSNYDYDELEWNLMTSEFTNVISVSAVDLYSTTNFQEPIIIMNYIDNNKFCVRVIRSTIIVYKHASIRTPSIETLLEFSIPDITNWSAANVILPCSVLVSVNNILVLYFWIDGIGLYEAKIYPENDYSTNVKCIYSCEMSSPIEHILGIRREETNCLGKLYLMVQVPYTYGVKQFDTKLYNSSGAC